MTERPPPDPALLELFRAELETHLTTLSAGVLSLEKTPDDAKQLESLMRAAHSIKGAAKIVGFDAAVQVSHHLEDCFVAAQRGQIRFTSDSVDVLLRGVDALSRLGTPADTPDQDSGLTPDALKQLIGQMAAVRSGQTPVSSSAPVLPPSVALPADVPASGATVPAVPADSVPAAERRGPTAVSQAAIYEFVGEAKEHLTGVVQDLLALEQRPGDSDDARIDRLFRAMHSVKGGAGFLGCQTIEELAHAVENVLEEVRQTGIAPNSNVVDALLAGTDRLLALLDDVERSNAADVSQLLQRLRQCRAGSRAAAVVTIAAPPAVAPASSGLHAAPHAASAAAPTVVESPAAGPAEAGGNAARGSDRAASVRIPVPLVDRLMTLAGELVLVRNQALRSIEAGDAAMRPVLQRLDALTSQLHGAVTQTRMQPVGNLFARFPRTVRDLARQLGKAIELEVSGTEVELDKSVLELLSDPLNHLIRNCCDHGLEPPDERTRAGKPALGRVLLSASQQGGQICIEVRDDGRGIDPQRIKRRALESGLRTAVELARLSDREALGLIALPGFSTAAAVTDLSGRGVGMDVVKTNLDQLGGTLEIDSVPGQGSAFALRVPLTLAIIPCLMVRTGELRYAIPQKDLEELVCVHPEQTQMRIETTLDQEVIRLRERLLPLVRLAEVLDRPLPFDDATRETLVRRHHRTEAVPHGDAGSPATGAGAADPRLEHADDQYAAPTFFAVVKAGSRRFGLVVDEILKNEEIVVKPLHSWLKTLTCFSGATILGDGRVALILNMEGLAQHAGIRFGEPVQQRASAEVAGRGEAANVLLFRYGPQEQFAVPLAMLRRLVMVTPDRIERVGMREFVDVDGGATPLVRLDQVLPVSAAADANPLFLLLPRNLARPLAIVATSIIDTEPLPTELNPATFQADGVVGSAMLRGRLTLLLDFSRLAERADSAGSARPAPPAGRRQRILAVDDTEFFRELLRGYLETAGYAVVTAANGTEAIRELDAGSFELVVSDIEMPVMDGWALARAIRQRPEGTALPVLALTTLSSDADRARAKTCGFDGYEVKLDRQQFLTTVEELLRTSRVET